MTSIDLLCPWQKAFDVKLNLRVNDMKACSIPVFTMTRLGWSNFMASMKRNRNLGVVEARYDKLS